MIYIERLDNQIQQLRAALRCWRSHLLRPAPAILLALIVMLAEPLACALHCQIAIPWLLRHQQIHLHAQPQPAASGAPLRQISDSPGFIAGSPMLPVSSNCFQAASNAPTPAVPPSPVHDLVLLAALLLIGVAHAHHLSAPAPLATLTAGSAPPTPPPRLPALSV